jgi:hypothetical protein
MRTLQMVLRSTPLLVASLFVFSLAGAPASGAEESNDAKTRSASAVEKAATEQQLTEPTNEQAAALEKLMSGATMVGHFTVTGEGGDAKGGEGSAGGKLTEERYELGDVKRLDNGKWLIQSRIRYGDHDVTIPLTLPIRWAGDTPVICVDELPIPGLGTFTARVMIYRGHYAGFWTGADHGGHLFGVIEPAKEDAK